MLDFIAVHLRRIKWDMQHYARYMWRDVLICCMFIIFGFALGIMITYNSETVKQCVISKVMNGTYSSVGTFAKVIVYSAFTIALISFTGFLKCYRLVHYMIIFYWGYRFGVEIISLNSVFIWFFSLILIYLPFYLFSYCVFISLILFIRLTIPSPRPNWWCYSPCLMRNLYRRSFYLMMPILFINAVIFIVCPMFIRIFIVVI